ncbi:O-antigen ligase family protein [Listeria booriae]|uniref:O-antigen ligase family protein n=1 Tax=Listeria booriae TaxID=1552123 RepID=UPI0021ADE1F4|nr:O-antigen ligase family protein [Listeria booriae]
MVANTVRKIRKYMPIIKWISENYKIVAFFLVAIITLEICIFIPYGYVLVGFLLIAVVLLCFRINMEKCMFTLSIILLCAGFFGPYLGLPAMENIFLFRVLLPIHLVLFLFFYKKDWERIRKIRIFLLLYILFIFTMSITLFWTDSLGGSIRYIYFLFEWLYVFFICVYFLKDVKSYRVFAKCTVFLYILFISIGLWEVTTGMHLPRSGSTFYITTTSEHQPTGFQFNTNDYAALLTILFPVVMIEISKWKKKVAIVAISIISFVAIYLVIVTFSRMAMLVILIEAIILLVSWMRSWTFMGVILGGLGVTLVSFYFKWSLVSQMFSDITRAFTDKNGSTLERMEMYKATWSLIEKSNFIGIGAGMLPTRLSTVMYGFENTSASYWSPHNYWLEALANGGILAFLPLITFFILYFISSLYYWIKTGWKMDSAVPLLIGVAFVFASIGLSGTFDKMFLGLGLGIGMSILNIHYRERSEKEISNQIEDG